MVVDDEPDVELLFRQRFKREIRAGSLRLHFAHSGEEALAQLKEPGSTDVVLILSDINMEGVLQGCAAQPLRSLVGSVTEEVQKFVAGAPRADDLTIMTLRYRG